MSAKRCQPLHLTSPSPHLLLLNRDSLPGPDLAALRADGRRPCRVLTLHVGPEIRHGLAEGQGDVGPRVRGQGAARGDSRALVGGVKDARVENVCG